MNVLIEEAQANRIIFGSSEWFEGLGSIFSRYQIPIGLISKLMKLRQFDALHFLIDDSGSMGMSSTGRYQTMSRWEEVRLRLKTMMAILAFIPIKKIIISFLNHPHGINMDRPHSQTPQEFTQVIDQRIDQLLSRPPRGFTPLIEAIQRSINLRGSVARYFFGDGVPNGGIREINSIKQMIENRTNATENPITFIACSDNDQDVEWMFEIAETAPNCAALSDYQNEAHEVRSNQGAAFPYTEGFHLIDQLVGVLNPDDIGRLHESIRLNLQSLNNIMGVEYTEQQYRHYCDRFDYAQRNLPGGAYSPESRSQGSLLSRFRGMLGL
jgi:hypothetical protein